MYAMKESTKPIVLEPYWFSKGKLPRGLSYPLKRSLLDSALHEASVYDAVYSVRFLESPTVPLLLDANFVSIGRNVHPTVVGRSVISIHAVPSTKRHAVEELIVAEALPALCDWLAKTQNEENSWRGMPHSIAFHLVGDEHIRATTE